MALWRSDNVRGLNEHVTDRIFWFLISIPICCK